MNDTTPLPMERYRCKFGEIEKLNSSNYTHWARNVRAFMRGEDCLKIVLREEEEPSVNNYTRWKEYQSRKGAAYALIFASCTSEIQEYISSIDEPADMWDILHEKLDGAASRAGRTMIARQFNQSKPEANQPIQSYIAKLLQYRRRLSGTEQAISDEAFSSHLISTLPMIFNSFVDIVLHQPEGYSVENLISKVVEAEATLETRTKEQGSLNTSLTSGSALFTSHEYSPMGNNRGNRFTTRISGRNSYRGNQRRRSGRQDPATCWYCGLRGHKESECRTKKRAAQLSHRRRPEGNCSSAAVSVTRVQALVATRRRVLAYQEWIIDSGATYHICHSRSSFYYLARLPEQISIILGDRSEIFAYESGKIRLNLTSECSIDISAIYVPSFSISLLSIGQLSSQYSITFTEMTCSIIRPSVGSANQQIELATFTNGLYRMKAEVSSQTTSRAEIFAATSTAKPTLELWHQRFGHIGRNSLRLALGESLPKSKDSALVPTCEPCILGKQHENIIRTPVPPVSRPFELIHSDVCGPIAVPSFSGQKYFVVYIDDYSRRVWVYFVKSKDSLEMTSVFQEFLARMDKAYPKWPIARFRCDNGRGEYDNRLFRGILRVSGISFEPAPPYTQHKNGKGERMIQTLITKARTLLIDAKLPTAM